MPAGGRWKRGATGPPGRSSPSCGPNDESTGRPREAEEQLKSIDRWWFENRRASPDLFLDELAQAIDLLSEFPDIGSPFKRTDRPGVRRLLLRRSKHWVYYFHERGRSIVFILAIWSTFRGSDPPLPEPVLK